MPIATVSGVAGGTAGLQGRLADLGPKRVERRVLGVALVAAFVAAAFAWRDDPAQAGLVMVRVWAIGCLVAFVLSSAAWVARRRSISTFERELRDAEGQGSV
jgi:hypothetical protein